MDARVSDCTSTAASREVPAGRHAGSIAMMPHGSRHGLVMLSRGRLKVVDNSIVFETGGSPDLPEGRYAMPHELVSAIVLGPGTSITHDALRVLARSDVHVMGSGHSYTHSHTHTHFTEPKPC